MMTLEQDISTQENMEAWYRQLDDENFPLVRRGILSLIKPRFYGCDLAKKEASFVFTVEEWQLNVEGGVHGGIITTSFDTAFGLLCHYFAKQQMICTVNLNTTFLKPIRPNQRVIYRVCILSLGRTIVSMRGEAFAENAPEVLLATADTSFMILHKKLPQSI